MIGRDTADLRSYLKDRRDAGKMDLNRELRHCTRVEIISPNLCGCRHYSRIHEHDYLIEAYSRIIITYEAMAKPLVLFFQGSLVSFIFYFLFWQWFNAKSRGSNPKKASTHYATKSYRREVITRPVPTVLFNSSRVRGARLRIRGSWVETTHKISTRIPIAGHQVRGM